jgi:hypothetical protein
MQVLAHHQKIQALRPACITKGYSGVPDNILICCVILIAKNMLSAKPPIGAGLFFDSAHHA